MICLVHETESFLRVIKRIEFTESNGDEWLTGSKGICSIDELEKFRYAIADINNYGVAADINNRKVTSSDDVLVLFPMNLNVDHSNIKLDMDFNSGGKLIMECSLSYVKFFKITAYYQTFPS